MTIAKTDEGQRVLKDRSISLTPRQRTALVMIDGTKSLKEVLAATAAMGVSPDDIRHLVELGLVAERAAEPEAPAAKPAKPAAAASADRFLAAYQAAVRLTAELGLKGMRLNMAVEGATNFEQLVALLPRLQAALKPERYAELEELLRT
jgi:hypothetical protein